jgi:prevent-host-death family protein
MAMGGDMREQEPMTQTMKASEARAQFSTVLNQVYRKQKRVVVEKSGIPVAAIVSAEDLQALQRLEAERSADFDVLFRIGNAFKDVPDEELAREVSAALTQVRTEQRKHEG